MMPLIATKFQYVSYPFLIFIFTHNMFRPLRAILRRDIQLDVSKDYSFYNGSAVRTQLDVCLYRYFDPWSPIHVTKLSLKAVKTLIFTVKLVSFVVRLCCIDQLSSSTAARAAVDGRLGITLSIIQSFGPVRYWPYRSAIFPSPLPPTDTKTRTTDYHSRRFIWFNSNASAI
jgi:hypothetical protein